MESTELSKTSDEIINELFSSLNVPLSPKPVAVEERKSKGEQASVHTKEIDNSEDEESDSKSSESEGETKTTVVEIQEDSKTDKVEKLKSQKKKKEKRKKKKRHKKKEDGGRHKHKKKKKKESFETAEEAKLAADVLQDVKVKNQAFIQKIIQEEFRQLDIRHCKTSEKCKSESISPKLHRSSKSPDAPYRIDGLDEKKRPEKSHSDPNCKETLHEDVPLSSQERPSDSSSLTQRVSESCSKDNGSVPSGKPEESASKSVAERSPSQETSPGPQPVCDQTQGDPTVSDSCKRKQSPHSHSPSPTCMKKIKSSNSSSSSKSSSPKTNSRQRSPSCAKRSRSGSAKDSKSESGSKDRKSRSRSRKRSKSKRSRSHSRKRSISKSRKSGSGALRRSRSRSKKRSRSRSRKRSRSKKRSRSRSKSKKRSGSKSKIKSRSKSRNRSRSISRKRSASKSRKSFQSKTKRSRSKERSKSRSRKRSKSNSRRESTSKSRRSRSRGRSKSKSRKRSQSRSHSRRRSRSRLRRSRSKSAKRSSSKSRRSRSRRKSGSQSHRRSRSGSSHKSSPAKERFDMFAVMRERANRLAELKSQCIPDGSLGSLLLSSVQSLSVPTPDPSSIPLPNKESLPTHSPKDEVKEEASAEVEEDKTALPVVDDPVNLSSQGQDTNKPKEASKGKQEEGNDKGKLKTIITIKSLKDSIVFQQAQEEAERKAKEKVNQPVMSENSCSANTEQQHLQEAKDVKQEEEANRDETMSLTERKVDSRMSDESDWRRKEEKERGEEKDKRKDEETQRRESETESTGAITNKEEKKRKETDYIQTKEEKEVQVEKYYTKKRIVDKPEDKEDDKGDKYSSIKEDEKRIGNELLNKAEEAEDKDKPSSRVESEEETRKKQSSKSGEKEGRESKMSSKREEKEEIKRNKCSKAEEVKGNKHFDKGEDEVPTKNSCKTEEKDKISKQSSKGEEKNKAEKEESKKIKVSSKSDEKDDEQMSKQPNETEEKEESNQNKPCSKDESGKNGHAHPEQDSADKIEEGEIVSDKEEAGTKSSSKTHSKKKSKKDKSSTKEKKKSHREKGKNKDERKKAREKKEQDRARSRSKDRHKSRQQSSSSSKDHSHSRRHRRRSRTLSRSRSRSRFRDRSSRQHRRSHSRSRSKSRSKRRRESTSDLRDKVTRKRLLEIARRNAVYLMQNGCLPPSVEQEQLVKIKAGGKSVDELTDFCKQLVASGNYSDVDVSEPSISSEEENNSEKPFSSTRHPFSVRDSKPILMNIRNAPMLPTKTNAERLAGQAKLREQFPVSSGSQHRTKESEWVPVPPKEKKEEDKVFTKPEVPPVDISQIVSTRLSAMRKLQDNPNDSEAIKTLNNVQKEMQNWALSKQEPGQFTGTTGVKVLSQEELSSGHQAWARKEQFKEAAPVRPQFGLKMLQKMGWSPGEGLGKNKEGTTEPLLLDVKMDKKGFHAQEEVTPKKQPVPLVKDLSGKHPVSALVELCSKRKWSPPDFEMVFDCGPDHKKNFLMKVMVNGQEFKPSVAASTKKMAKANAAAAYLQSLGLYPKDPHYPL